MTKKKETILLTALSLFAKDGFAAVSTNKIAKVACVSEGLIFRHFKNKEGLLNAILSLGKEKSQTIFSQLEQVESPANRLKEILMIPFQIPQTEYPFWKLLYQIKWQADEYDQEMSVQLRDLLIKTFKQLNYTNAEDEAEFALVLFDGIATSILLKQSKTVSDLQDLILKKYNL